MKIQEYIDQLIKENGLENELNTLYMKIHTFIMETLYSLKDHRESIPKMELTITRDKLIHQIIIRKLIYMFRRDGWSIEVSHLFEDKIKHIFNIRKMWGDE